MRDGLGVHTAEGALGGALGTLFIGRAMRMTQRLPEKLRPTMPDENPAELVIRALERLREKPLSRAAREGLEHALHWAYGITWGGLLGLATSRVRIRTIGSALLAGAALGGAVWAIGYAGWLPLTRLTPPVHQQGAKHAGTSLLTHIGYGLVSAAPIYLLDRLARRRPWYRRVLQELER
jgi:hypothetical protein